MNVVGILLKSDQLRIVTLSGTKKSHQIIEKRFNKITVPRDNDPSQIDLIKNTLITFFKTNKIESIGVNGRAVSGKMAGSPLTFKSEGILIAISGLLVKHVFTQTIRATDRTRYSEKTCRPSTKDLGIAYDIAFEMLPE